MNKQEAIHVLETIKDVYPRYELSKPKASMLMNELLRMDYARVMKKLANHVTAHPYPPTIAEIAAYSREKNEQLNTLRKWREQARDVPEEFKRTFHKQMLELIKEQKLWK